jgi:hypothetical protein
VKNSLFMGSRINASLYDILNSIEEIESFIDGKPKVFSVYYQEKAIFAKQIT